MCKPTILLVDNEPRFLAISKTYMERAQYSVLTANDAAEALRTCREQVVHLAVIDIRLQDNTDESDFSGLHLAAELPLHIFKIILTGESFPNSEILVRKTIESDDQGRVLAASFIWKQEGPEKVLETIRKAFRFNIKLNPKLKVNLAKTITWRTLVEQVKKLRELDDDAKQKAEVVLRDLTCKLFHEKSLVHFWQTSPGHGHCTVAWVQTKVDETKGVNHAIKLGPRESIEREAENYKQYVEPFVARAAVMQQGPVWSREMGAIAYTFLGEEDQVKTFRDYYNDVQISNARINEILNHLFNACCRNWYTGRRRPQGGTQRKHLDILYREILNLDNEKHIAEIYQRRDDLIERSLTGNFPIQLLDDKTLRIQIADKLQLKLPDPIHFTLEKYNSETGQNLFPLPSQIAITHGDLHSDNIIVSNACRTWLIDFYKTGRGPAFRDFAALESDIKFTLFQSKSLRDCYQLEQALVEFPNSLLDAFVPQFKQPEQLRALEAIRCLRELANNLTGEDALQEYLIALLFYALKRITGYTSSNIIEPAGNTTHSYPQR